MEAVRFRLQHALPTPHTHARTPPTISTHALVEFCHAPASLPLLLVRRTHLRLGTAAAWLKGGALLRPRACVWGSCPRAPRYAESPKYLNGRQLRSYQLEGLNWLVFSWYQVCVWKRALALEHGGGGGYRCALHKLMVRCGALPSLPHSLAAAPVGHSGRRDGPGQDRADGVHAGALADHGARTCAPCGAPALCVSLPRFRELVPCTSSGLLRGACCPYLTPPPCRCVDLSSSSCRCPQSSTGSARWRTGQT